MTLRPCRLLKTKNTQLKSVSREMVCKAKSRPRKNPSECADLPEDYLAITIIQIKLYNKLSCTLIMNNILPATCVLFFGT